MFTDDIIKLLKEKNGKVIAFKNKKPQWRFSITVCTEDNVKEIQVTDVTIINLINRLSTD